MAYNKNDRESHEKHRTASGWARIELRIMQSEERQKKHIEDQLIPLKKKVEALEHGRLEHLGEHVQINGRLDAHKDKLGEIGTDVKSIKDAMVIGRVIAAIVRLFRGGR